MDRSKGPGSLLIAALLVDMPIKALTTSTPLIHTLAAAGLETPAVERIAGRVVAAFRL
jgi:hypothetical protein